MKFGVRSMLIRACFAVAVACVAVVIAAYASRAEAEHVPSYQGVRCWHNCYDRTYYAHDTYRRREHYEPRRHYREAQCKPLLMREGDQYASEDGARKEADKAWRQAARWQYGEKFMDIDHAAGVKYVCSRSSVGSVVGQTFTRCEVRARPCPPKSERD